MYKQKVLILGGSTEGFLLAEKITQKYQGTVEIITSFAGITKKRRAVVGKMRVGGFGGVDGLAAYLKSEAITHIIDATHPFAAQMKYNADQAVLQRGGVQLCHIMRPKWEAQQGDEWLLVGDMAQAAHCLNGFAKGLSVFLAVGRKELAAFQGCSSQSFIARVIDPPEGEVMPPQIEFIIERGPFDLAKERALFKQRRIEVLVCKNSGGAAAAAKLQVAREQNIPVVMVQRPFWEQENCVPTVEAAMEWLKAATD